MGKSKRGDRCLSKYKIINNYKDDQKIRASFCELGRKTFGINFEDYYQSGYWRGNYDPHSIMVDGEIVANISVNTMTVYENGIKHDLIQLGTVMTDDGYRHQGMSRAIMEHILDTYSDAEGIYLFANDSVLDFYPKFGFRKAKEYYREGSITGGTKITAVKVPMAGTADWRSFEKKISEYRSISSFAFDSIDLYMFYLTSFMKDDLYYIEETDSYVIVEIEDNVLNISEIWSRIGTYTDFYKVCEAFGNTIDHVRLGFVLDNSEFELKNYIEENTTLFVMGKWFNEFDSKKNIFPPLTHA